MRTAIVSSFLALLAGCATTSAMPEGAPSTDEVVSAEPVGARPEAAPPASGVGLNYKITAIATDYPTASAGCDAGEAFQCVAAARLAPSDPLKLKAIRRGCELRDVPSCAVLGVATYNGEFGIAPDRVAALPLLKQACEAGIPAPDTHKMMPLLGIACLAAGGEFLDIGDGKTALPLLDRGCPTQTQCCRGAATVLFRAIGVAQDKPGAREYMQRACRSGDDPKACEDVKNPAFW